MWVGVGVHGGGMVDGGGGYRKSLGGIQQEHAS